MTLLLAPLDARVALKGLLGAGGMGEVHRAWDAVLERPVAVKFVRSGDPREADRLVLEARLQARVEHPNVVRVHDTGTLGGRPCILLQLVEGATFADLAGGTDWRLKVELAAQAARGLGAAHRSGLVHRDVKPANILVEHSGEGPRACLSDFGLARDEEGGLTRSGLLVGSVDYMAPEQLLHSVPVDFRADIYGLGASLYAVLAGHPPFRGSQRPTAPSPGTQDAGAPTGDGDPHPGDLLRRILEDAPRSLLAEVPGVPKDLAAVVAKAMEKEATHRYATAEAFSEDLERVLRGEPVLIQSQSWVERGLRWARRNPAPARALAASLAMAVATAGFVAWRSRRSALEALEAARIGGEAKALELQLRMAHLAPPHDLSKVHAALEAGLVHLAGRHGAAAAAADYARGRVLLLLDRPEEAREALLSARTHGYRGPELDEALGFASGRLFQRTRPEFESLKDETLRAERRRVAEREFQAPALEHLRAAGNTPYHQAFIAMVEGDYPRCREQARRARQEDPEQVEASLLELEAWTFEAQEKLDEVDRPGARASVIEGLRCGADLSGDLRSDPAVPLLMARLKGVETSLDQAEGRGIQAAFEAGHAFTEQALRLDPDHAEAWLVRSKLLEDACKVATDRGTSEGLDLGQRQVEAARRAASLRPGLAAYLINLGTALYTFGHAKALHGRDPVAEFAEGRRAGRKAGSLEPWNPRGIHGAALNALDEARYRLSHGTDAKEALDAAEELLGRLQDMRGIHPRLVRPLLADLRGHQAQSAWGRGEDPDRLQVESFDRYEALRAEDPARMNRTADVGYAAVTWAQTRVARGGSVADILEKAQPALKTGLDRWPGQPLLTYYEAWLRALRLFDREGSSPAARDPKLSREAAEVFERCRKVMRNPGVVEIRAWTHLARAEAGLPGAAARARADFEFILQIDKGSRDPLLGLVRALRQEGSRTGAERSLALLDGLDGFAKEEAEVMLVRATVLGDLGRPAEAEALKARALARQPLLAGHPLLRAARPAR